MKMKSMTGFGLAKNKNGLNVNIRAVNGRFLDIRLHSPKEYYVFEQEIKTLVGNSFGRGTVEVYINRSASMNSSQQNVKFSEQAAEQWLQAYDKLSKKMKAKPDWSVDTIAKCQGVMSLSNNSTVSKEEKKQVLDLVKKASVLCEKEKVREGKALQSILKKLLADLVSDLSIISKQRIKANTELKQRMLGRWQKLGIKESVDPQRVAQEIVIQLDKTDIEEEVSRLKEHIRMMKALMTKRTAKGLGKKLDFYTQELLREVNTIGSKSHHSVLTESVINAKSIIERFREQVQNIE